MNFAWNLDLGTFITSLIVIVIFYSLLISLFIRNVNRRTPFIILTSLFVVGVLSFLLQLIYPFVLVCCLTVIFVVLVLLLNLTSLRKSFSGNHKKTNKSETRIEKIYDRDVLLNEIRTAVISLSKSKTGALITFAKTDSLSESMKNGVAIDAPVKAELLETIFYPGTRLHDGAVIVKDGIVKAAAVFFSPSTKSFAGKYGSRHRAAIGISETTDSVTIVVSEETGRISIAVDGKLESVTTDNLVRALNIYLYEDR